MKSANNEYKIIKNYKKIVKTWLLANKSGRQFLQPQNQTNANKRKTIFLLVKNKNKEMKIEKRERERAGGSRAIFTQHRTPHDTLTHPSSLNNLCHILSWCAGFILQACFSCTHYIHLNAPVRKKTLL